MIILNVEDLGEFCYMVIDDILKLYHNRILEKGKCSCLEPL